MKRLFIAINLPSDIKNKVEKLVDDLKISINQHRNNHKSEPEIKFLPPENWHLTLVFLGYQPDEAIGKILNSIKETLNKYPNFLSNIRISFEKLILAPASTEVSAGKPPKPPRMIWLTGTKETSEILGQFKNDLENNLIKNGVQFKQENRRYNCHLTLARFKLILRTVDVLRDVRCPQIKNLSFIAQSIDLMESKLKRAGAEYKTLMKLHKSTHISENPKE